MEEKKDSSGTYINLIEIRDRNSKDEGRKGNKVILFIADGRSKVRPACSRLRFQDYSHEIQ